MLGSFSDNRSVSAASDAIEAEASSSIGIDDKLGSSWGSAGSNELAGGRSNVSQVLRSSCNLAGSQRNVHYYAKANGVLLEFEL